RSITRVYLLTSTEITGGGGWATLTGEYNAGLSFNIDRNNWGCATSRAFREVACGTADTVRLRFTRPRSDLHLQHFPLIHSYQTGRVPHASRFRDVGGDVSSPMNRRKPTPTYQFPAPFACPSLISRFPWHSVAGS